MRTSEHDCRYFVETTHSQEETFLTLSCIKGGHLYLKQIVDVFTSGRQIMN